MDETNPLNAVITVGVALAGLILTSNRGLRQDMKQMEGLLEGLREAISGRAAAR